VGVSSPAVARRLARRAAGAASKARVPVRRRERLEAVLRAERREIGPIVGVSPFRCRCEVRGREVDVDGPCELGERLRERGGRRRRICLDPEERTDHAEQWSGRRDISPTATTGFTRSAGRVDTKL
jgi:hypothetical protein